AAWAAAGAKAPKASTTAPAPSVVAAYRPACPRIRTIACVFMETPPGLTLPKACTVRVAPHSCRYALIAFSASFPWLPLCLVPAQVAGSRPSLRPAGTPAAGAGRPLEHGRCGPAGPFATGRPVPDRACLLTVRPGGGGWAAG